MKKSLLIVALALVVAGSLVAGTMAQYVKYADPGNVTPAYKQFAFTAANTTTAANVGLKIAPGETKSWIFSVANYSGNQLAETAMNITLAITDTASIPAGLKFFVNGIPVEAKGAAVLAASLTGNKWESAAVVLSATWTDGDNDIALQGQSGSVALQFTAKQAPDPLPVPALSAQKSGLDGVIVKFTTPKNQIDLGNANSDIRIEYLDANGYVIKSSDSMPLIKSKSWSSFLCDSANTTVRYPIGTIPDTTYPGNNVIPANTALETSTYGTSSWLGAGKLTNLAKVVVTINDNGVLYRSEVVPN